MRRVGVKEREKEIREGEKVLDRGEGRKREGGRERE